MTLIQSVPTEIRQLDLNSFHLELRDLEDDTDGRPWPKTHSHNTTVTVGGVTLARVIEILDPYTITFEDGQYAVNLVAANSNVGDRVNVNQVSVRSANSAGLVDLEILIASAYQGHVVVSPSRGQAGTDEPIGTFQVPSSNMVDALAIAVKQGVRKFTLLDSMTITEDLSLGYEVEGISPFISIMLADAADVSGCSFTLATVSGQLDGLNTVREVALAGATDVSGFLFQSAMVGENNMTGNTTVLQCYSNEATTNPSFIVTSGNLIVRDFRGSFAVKGVTAGEHSIGVYGGRMEVSSTCTGGVIYLRGDPYDIIDNSGAGCTVIDQTAANRTADITLNVLEF